MGIKFANSAFATLAAGINSSATSITLTTGQGARFPSLAGGDYFFATLIDTSNNLEIVKCTARSTDVLTVVRGQESTTARSFATGDRIELRVTAQGIADSSNIDVILPSQTGNSGKYLTTDGAASSWGTVDLTNLSATNLTSGTIPKARMFAGSVVKVSSFTDATRVALSDSAGPSNIWTVSISKEFSSALTDLYVYGNLQGRGNYSDQCGVYAHISGSTSRTTDGSAFYDVDFYPSNGTYRPGGIVLLGKRFESLGVGSHTLEIGWQTRNGSSGDKPYLTFNPNSSDESRSHQHRSNLVVYEILR